MVVCVQTSSRLQEECRRFKIKLAASENASSMEVCRQCLLVLSNFITFKEISSQSGVHENSFMDSQSLLDCSTMSQQLPQSPVRNTITSSSSDIISHSIPSTETAPRVETSSLAKVQLFINTYSHCDGYHLFYYNTH